MGRKMKRRSKSMGPPSFVHAGNDDEASHGVENIYKPIKIFVFKNRDEYHPATEIPITRSHYKTWLVFLDYVGKRLGTLNAVHYLCSMNGKQLGGFNDLENEATYVAVSDKFVKANYGGRIVEGGFKYVVAKDEVKHGGTLTSPEALQIYMEKMKFQPGAIAGPPKAARGPRPKLRKKKKKAAFAAVPSPPKSPSQHSEEEEEEGEGEESGAESGVGTGEEGSGSRKSSAVSRRSGSVPASAASRRTQSGASQRTTSRASGKESRASAKSGASSRPATDRSRRSGRDVDDTEEEDEDEDGPVGPPPRSILA